MLPTSNGRIISGRSGIMHGFQKVHVGVRIVHLIKSKVRLMCGIIDFNVLIHKTNVINNYNKEHE